jgi:hypothetical protein
MTFGSGPSVEWDWRAPPPGRRPHTLIGVLTIAVKPLGVAGIVAATVINRTILLVFLAIHWRRTWNRRTTP